MGDSVMRFFDIRNPMSAYVFGFMQADGHHSAGTRRRGRVTIEIKASDVDVLRVMQQAIPWRTSITFRTRTTNFVEHAHSAVLTLYALEGRERLLELGLPIGRKSAAIAPPAEPFSHRDYLRGIYDGDGSVGFTVTGIPFLSLVTASPAIAEFVCAEILRVTGARRNPRPNKRDGVFNIMIASDPAAAFARWLYRDACIALTRKRAAAVAVASWTRPETMRARAACKRWTSEEDAVVMKMTVKEAAKRLGRTVGSVGARSWRLHQIVNAM